MSLGTAARLRDVGDTSDRRPPGEVRSPFG